VYVPGRLFASAVTVGVGAGAAGFAGAFFETVVWAWGFFEAVAFFAVFAPAFFFIFMGRNVQQPPSAGQVNADVVCVLRPSRLIRCGC
jgi:hypothetical protein